MDLKQLEYVVTIAEEGSFARAARKLYISQSALSQCLSRLTQAEQLPPLFYKEHNELRLTDAGRIYINGAKTILRLAAQADETAQGRCTSIRLSIAPIGEFSFLTQVLPRFKEEFPDISLNIQYLPSTDARKLLADGVIDLAFVIDRSSKYTFFRIFPIFCDQVIWLSSPKADDHHHTKPVIMPPAQTNWNKTCQHICTQEGINGPVFCETSDLTIIKALLKQYPLTAFCLKSAPICADFVSIPLKQDYPYHFFAITPKNAVISSPMERMIDLMCTFMCPEHTSSFYPV